MNKGFLLIGSIIFALYLYFTFWNIYKSHNKQKENHYPELSEDEIFEEYDESNEDKSNEK